MSLPDLLFLFNFAALQVWPSLGASTCWGHSFLQTQCHVLVYDTFYIQTESYDILHRNDHS